MVWRHGRAASSPYGLAPPDDRNAEGADSRRQYRSERACIEDRSRSPSHRDLYGSDRPRLRRAIATDHALFASRRLAPADLGPWDAFAWLDRAWAHADAAPTRAFLGRLPDACDPASASVHSVRTREARNDELCRGELTPQRGFKLVMKHQRKRARYGPDFKRVLERATGLEPAN